MAYRIQLDIHGWVNGNYGEVPEAIEDVRKLYQAELHYGDYLVGRLVKGLKEEGLYDKTVLIIASDLAGADSGLHGGNVVQENPLAGG